MHVALPNVVVVVKYAKIYPLYNSVKQPAVRTARSTSKTARISS